MATDPCVLLVIGKERKGGREGGVGRVCFLKSLCSAKLAFKNNILCTKMGNFIN